MLIIGTQASLENPKMDAFKLLFIKTFEALTHTKFIIQQEIPHI